MNRCLTASTQTRHRAALLLGTLLALAHVGHAQSQTPRNFPDHALRGKMVVVQPPAITLNGEPARLSPGARIRSQSNTLVLSGALVGQEVVVNYVRDGHGLVHEVWVLTASEAAEKRAGAGDERNFRFSSDTPARAD